VGTLYLVSAPIGNLEDITLRARHILESEQLFLAEDTRVVKSLMSLYGISLKGKEVISFHEHSSDDDLQRIVEILKGGRDLYFFSDAGSPIISDPAYPLVKRIIAEGIEVRSCPGASSLISALEVSGLPPHPFTFYGFFPRDKERQRRWMQLFKRHSHTSIFFESPKRIEGTLSLLAKELPAADVVLARELTKKFETVYRFKAEGYQGIENFVTKGEFVVLVHLGKELVQEEMVDEALKGMVADYLEGKRTTKKLAKIFAKLLSSDTSSIYDQLSK